MTITSNKITANNEYFARILTVVNKLRVNKAKIEDVDVIEKILRSMTPQFNYVVCSIEESKDLDVITIDELQSTLLVHEQRMKPPVVEEQALKISFRETSGGRGRGRSGMRGRGRNGGRRIFDKSTIECYRCNKLGHFQYECPNKDYGSRSNYIENNEEMLLMACVEEEKSDDRSINVMGKSSVRLLVNGFIQVITSVFYVPGLRNNLLSSGQLMGRGLEILKRGGSCKIYHPEKGAHHLGLIKGITEAAVFGCEDDDRG
nr:hypothetical protein [Tanacetum cinerariifolium]